MLTRCRPVLSELPVFIGAAAVPCLSKSTVNLLLAEHFNRTRQDIGQRRKHCNKAQELLLLLAQMSSFLTLNFTLKYISYHGHF
jgi:hypothetical protein